MKPLRLAVIGLGRLGRACAEVILDAEDLALAGVVRRPASLALPLPNSLPNVTAVSHFTELDGVDAAIVCVPTEHALEAIIKLLHHRIPIVECATVHGDAFRTRKADIERMAKRHRVAAVLGAGWDPGALSLFRALFALLTPKGHTEITDRPGHSLHHGLAVKAMPGVKDALCAEFPAGNGKIQRYVYVEVREGADFEQVSQAIRSDPLFLDEESLVFPVESVALLEDAGRGVVMERRGESGRTGHQFLMLEARFDITALTSEIMIAAARALPRLRPGAHSLLDVPTSSLFGATIGRAEAEWI
jgi:diaminopimelate dehydrogenase